MSDDSQEDPKFSSLGNLILDLPLYEVYEFDSARETLGVQFFQGTVDTYCVHCDRESVFRREIQIPQVTRPKYGKWIRTNELSLLISGDVNRIQIEWEDTVFGPVGAQNLDDYLKSSRAIALNFLCSRNQYHDLIFFFILEDKSLIKIGQFPSVADLYDEKTKKYRKVLEINFPS